MMKNNNSENSSRSVLNMKHDEACTYFLKEESYCNFDLPPYFTFQKILSDVDATIKSKKISDFYDSKLNPRDFYDVNYTILNNKDGKYAWRPIKLIHPAIYVSLVHNITSLENWETICNRFKGFLKNTKIECVSLPRESLCKNSDKAEQVKNWWSEIEQKSIELALDYEFLSHTDITDCYGSIYTHSIAWSLHDKDFAKKNRGDHNLLGNIIDNHLQDMSHGQTNGIPQGSTLMDFIAEIVLGYADLNLSTKIKKSGIKDYKILRYRDDYRIFTNNPQENELIIKLISDVMVELGLKINTEKTKSAKNIILGSIKDDKLFWIRQKRNEGNLQKHLLIIHQLADEYPNSGSLTRALNDYYARLEKYKKIGENVIQLISISTDIAIKNPRTYPIISAIISLLIQFVDEDKESIVNKIINKFKNIPNTGHLKIWLQRAMIKFRMDDTFSDEPLCRLVSGSDAEIWNSSWLQNSLSCKILTKYIVDREHIETIDGHITKAEVSLFNQDYKSND